MQGFSDIDDESVCLDEVRTFIDSAHCTAAFPTFRRIRSQGKLCDVTLVAEGQEFSAHRVVLAATVPFFYGMFTHDMLEASKRKIAMPGIEASALEALINFAYSGEVQITPSNVQSLLIGASFLQMQNVREACCQYIMQRLCSRSVLSVRQFAQSYLCNQLVEATTQFACEHFEELSTTSDFLDLSIDDVVELLNRDELHVSSEERVFTAALAWLKHDVEKREELVPRVLRCIRLPLLSPQFLTDKVASEDIIRYNIECRDLLDEARDFLLLPERRSTLRTFRCQPRRSRAVMGYIYVVGGNAHSNDSPSIVERYDPIRNRWNILQNMNTHRSRVGVAVLCGRMYIMGGFDGVNRLRTVEVFDPVMNKWLSVASMNYQRSALGACSLNGRIWICGGYDGSASMRTCEVYFPEQDVWHMIPSMNDCRSAGGVVALGSKLYAMGGHNGLAIYDTVECYDVTNYRPESASGLGGNPSPSLVLNTPSTSSGSASEHWTYLAPMLTRRCRHGVATLNDRIYCGGGYNGAKFLHTVEVYNPKTNQWSRVASMSIPRSRVALASTFNCLYAIGGYDGTANLKTVECYNEEKNCWSPVASLRDHEGGVGVGVVPLQDLDYLGYTSTDPMMSSSRKRKPTTTTAAQQQTHTMEQSFRTSASIPTFTSLPLTTTEFLFMSASSSSSSEGGAGGSSGGSQSLVSGTTASQLAISSAPSTSVSSLQQTPEPTTSNGDSRSGR